MKASIICNSWSGNTRRVAEAVHAACGGNLVEVRSLEYSSRLSAYTIGCYRAVKGMCDRIEPAAIDVSGDDLIVIGTPVWAGRATPAINAAVAALAGCEGKKAVLFATCGGSEGETFRLLEPALAARGVTVTGTFAFNRSAMKDPERIGAMISAIKKTGEMS